MASDRTFLASPTSPSSSAKPPRRMPSPLPASAFAQFGGSPVKSSGFGSSPMRSPSTTVRYPPRIPPPLQGSCQSPAPKYWRSARSPEPKCSTVGQDSIQPRHFNITMASGSSPKPTTTRRGPPPIPRDLSEISPNPRVKTSSEDNPFQLKATKTISAPCLGGQATKSSLPSSGCEIVTTTSAPIVSGCSSRSLASSRSLTPTGMRKLSGAEEPVRILGVGSGGILELAQQVNDRMVSWALLRFQVGGGTFLRTKLVAIHCNGEDTSVMLRGWLNARSSEVLSLLGEVHANIDITRAKDLTVENICQRLLPLFAADNLQLSLTALYEEYRKVVQQMQDETRQRNLVAPPPAPAQREPEVRPSPKSAAEALRAVGAERGPCNWVLLEPRSLQLHSCGLGGLEDLKAHLVEDRVLFGALRLSFGSNRPGITKHIFVHWVGPRVSVVQRGLLNARLADATALVGKSCAVAFRREAHGLGDLRLEDIVAELRRLTVVDGIAATDGIAAGRISAAEYLAALKEETSFKQPEWEAEPEVLPSAAAPHANVDVKTAIEKVRSTTGEWNWVLCGWDRPEPNGNLTPIFFRPERPEGAKHDTELPPQKPSPSRGGA